jgi:large subunit ribosomal protein L32
MAQPCFRTSRSRMLKRRSHHAIKPMHTVLCPNCGAAKQPHSACIGCGYVRPGLQIKVRGGQ